MDTVTSKEIDGVVYTARFQGMAYAFELEQWINSGVSEYRIMQRLFDEVLISPDTDMDDFETLDELFKVKKFLLNTAYGNIGKTVSDAAIRKRLSGKKWACWRLLVGGNTNLDYDTVFHRMTPLEIKEANMALNKVLKKKK